MPLQLLNTRGDLVDVHDLENFSLYNKVTQNG